MMEITLHSDRGEETTYEHVESFSQKDGMIVIEFRMPDVDDGLYEDRYEQLDWQVVAGELMEEDQ